MKIVVLGGSPKGEVSVTMQYVKYLQKLFPQYDIKILQVAGPIHKLEKDEMAFKEIIDEVESSDGVLWAFPLYVFLVCSQYKRFIELIWERKAQGAFKDKYAASLSTSIHFYDHTAHNYIRSVCDDLKMKYVGFYSAAMHDLFERREQEKIKLFARDFFKAIEEELETVRMSEPLNWINFDYQPAVEISSKISTDKKIFVLTDSEQGNVGRMIERFKDCFENPVDVIDLNNVDIKGGCMGCLKCGQNNVCAYAGKDEFIDMYNGRLKSADVIIFAGEIRDRYLSSRWKMFFDRSFFNTHQRSLEGKQFAIFISGPLSQVTNLREILTAYVEWQGSNLADIITDESGSSAQIDRMIAGIAKRLTDNAECSYIRPATYLGIGGMKIFRDDVWGVLRVVFKADHRAYKKSGVYDFPQKKLFRNVFVRIFYLLTSIPWIYDRMIKNFKRFMIMPYRRVLETE